MSGRRVRGLLPIYEYPGPPSGACGNSLCSPSAFLPRTRNDSRTITDTEPYTITYSYANTYSHPDSWYSKSSPSWSRRNATHSDDPDADTKFLQRGIHNHYELHDHGKPESYFGGA